LYIILTNIPFRKTILPLDNQRIVENVETQTETSTVKTTDSDENGDYKAD
jgi:hypothetical protein